MIDVVVVGAGPTGLMLAAELRLCGATVRVIEKLPSPTGLSKALGIAGRTIDILEHRGLLDRFAAAQPPAPPRAAFFHFGGVPLDPRRLTGTPPRFLNLLQAHVEALLEERARELSVEIARGQELTALTQGAYHVRLTVSGAALDARFVVGCDGARSAVRKLCAIEFPGAPPRHLMRLGDVRLPADFVAEHGGGWVRGRPPFVPLGDGYVRLITSEPIPEGFDRDTPMTLDELRESARRVFGMDLPMHDPRWLSRFTDASRQAEHYRRGRVLLAGDAAHVVLPAGGPGINLGVNDAVNLGWKLAAEVRGTAPNGLLDSYHAERHPAGAAALRNTRAQGAMVQQTAEGTALRELFASLLEEPIVLRRIVDLQQGNDVRHDMHIGSRHPLVGTFTRAIPEAVASTSRARALLLVGANDAELALRAKPYSGAVDVVRTDSRDAMLVRPDGFVAWAGDAELLDNALATWFPRT
jgi:2-polyprenyl-6-methoxyphenol hydroxylase-like FAD-dependent oxidoreductase